MEVYSVKNLTFSYPQYNTPILHNLSFSISPGEFIALIGPSGCGKTTLLRCLKPSLAPNGVSSGEIMFEGHPLYSLDLREQSQKIGLVTQSPDNQIVTDKVWHELAFGLESLGLATPVIRLRVAEMASFFGLQNWFHQNVTELSGGQKQTLNLASVMTMQPSVLILDEPTGQLDPIAAAEFLDMVGRINRELGVTVILTEHRLEEVFPHASRVIVLDAGQIIADGVPGSIGATLKEQSHGMFAALPVPMRVYAAVDSGADSPVTVKEGQDWLNTQTIQHPLIQDLPVTTPPPPPAVEFDQVWFRFTKNSPDVLKGLSFKAYPREISSILGGNGTGKTTALSLAAGINKPYRGKVKLFGDDIGNITANKPLSGLLGILPQNPQSVFVMKTVQEDLLEILDDLKLPNEEKQTRVAAMARLCEIAHLTESHPYDLSGGEQQRAALAKILLLKPKALFLDEPTKGLDAAFKRKLAGILRDLTAQGVCVVLVSHDIEFCAEYADRCALFFDGCIVSEDQPRSFFCGNNFYTTAANRMARHNLPGAVTADDIIRAIGGEPFVPSGKASGMAAVHDDAPTAIYHQAGIVSHEKEKDKLRLSFRTLAAITMVLLAVPLSIYYGAHYLDDRKYYFISMLILLEAMLPFALVFEHRKPRSRELIVIAVLCAIAVAGRAAFFMLPQFKPVVALVIITGVALGGEAGFLVGAMTAFVSNMFLGQGPWTPWQMFAFGSIGFLAGLCFRKGNLARSTAIICVFGFFSALLIYGGIINPANVLLFQQNPTKEMFYLAYIQGLPFDLIHAAATVIFLAIAAKPMLEKLERIKVKHGLFSSVQ